jgi:PKD repeat protein
MFPQIVSNLSITPQAVNQLVFYGRRLAKEEVSRKLSMVFAVILIALQFAVILAPATPANAGDPNDIIHGGFTKKVTMLQYYDNRAELRALLNYFGIERADIVNSKEGEINSSDHSLLSLGRTPHSGDVKTIQCCGDTFYLRPLHVWDTTAFTIANGSTYKALVGRRQVDGGFFALMNACGNIVVRTIPKPKPTPAPVVASFACTDLKASPLQGKTPLTVNFTGVSSTKNDTIKEWVWNFGDGSKGQTTTTNKVSHVYKKGGHWTATLRVRDAKGNLSPAIAACSVTIHASVPPPPLPPHISQQKSALNLTQLVNGQPTDATKVTSQASDTIRYTLSTTNSGGSVQKKFIVQDNLTDILEYANVTELNGATLATDANGQQTIVWPAVDIAPGATVVKQFTVQVKDPVPTTARGVSNPDSFDFKMDNVYGNGITVPVETPAITAVAEGTSQNLPQTGAGTDALIIFAFGALVIYFWTRNRQLMTEVKVLRTEYQGGAL